METITPTTDEPLPQPRFKTEILASRELSIEREAKDPADYRVSTEMDLASKKE